MRPDSATIGHAMNLRQPMVGLLAQLLDRRRPGSRPGPTCSCRSRARVLRARPDRRYANPAPRMASRASISTITTSAKRTALSASATDKLFELLLDPRLAPQPRGVVNAKTPAAPFEVDGDGVARDAGFRPGEQTLLADQPIDQRRLAAVRPPDHGDVNGPRRIDFAVLGCVAPLLRRSQARRFPPAARRAAHRRDRRDLRRARPKSRSDRRGRAHRLRARPTAPPCPRTCWQSGSRACRSGAPDRRRRYRPASARRAHRSERRSRRLRRARPAVCACMRPERLSGAASSRPAVSITVKARSPSARAPSRRSRVTPGRSSTSARRLPTRRLNSVDLPTFGRPTMATVKLMIGTGALGVRALCRARAPNAISAAAADPAIARRPAAWRCCRWRRIRPLHAAGLLLARWLLGCCGCAGGGGSGVGRTGHRRRLGVDATGAGLAATFGLGFAFGFGFGLRLLDQPARSCLRSGGG